MTRIFAVLLTCLTCSLIAQNGQNKDANWPSFRGHNASGVADGYTMPVKWNLKTGDNILWKTAIEGLGHSSPVIWDQKIFLTSAVSGLKDDYLKVGLYGDVASVEDNPLHKWFLICLDKQSGKILWSKNAYEGIPRVKRHTKSSHANSTPATDGRFVVTFMGSEGLFCYDMDGNRVWHVDLGKMDATWGASEWAFASSPIIYQNKVLIQVDVRGESFVAAMDLETGKEIWKTARQAVAAWSSPSVFSKNGKTQMIVNGFMNIAGYDVENGKQLWYTNNGGDIPVPTPIVSGDVVYITGAHGNHSPLFGIKAAEADGFVVRTPKAKGFAWGIERGGNYMQTPIVYGDYVYACRDNGGLTCFNKNTGEVMYRKRLRRARSGYTASPVAADGKLYFVSEVGQAYVIEAGPEFKLLALNEMNEICMATPAISAGVIFYRTKGHLVAVGQKK